MSLYSVTTNSIIIDICGAIICILVGFIIYRIIDHKNRKKNIIVKKQAFTDQLTGRGNRYMFLSVLDKLIVKNKPFAVCFMDLDGFKQINDSMGHDAGDELLVSLANTFENKLPKNATAYRLGGDEFAIIIEAIRTTEDVTIILDELKENLKNPFIIDDTNISLEYSLGIAVYPEDAANRQDLIMYADDAMYYIKEHGKNDYYFHNKALKAKLENNNKMQKDLKVAYESGQFGLEFQPRIDINDTSKICFETLLYWKHPVLDKIPSSYFIKQADDMALTIKLDQYVLEEVCKKIHDLKEKGINNTKFAVNISNKHSEKKDFINRLCNIINDYSIEPGQIQIEITNTINVSKIENFKMMFEKLKECGAEIIISNIDVKYEHLKLFKELPINEVKVSASYLSSDINHDVLDNIISLIKCIGFKVVVIAIETENQLVESIKKGTDKIQGDFLFKKMDENLIDDYISKYDMYINRLDNIIISAKNIKKFNK